MKTGLILLLLVLIILSAYYKRAPISPVYYLIRLREVLVGHLVFGDEEKAYWYYTLVSKRISEDMYLSSLSVNPIFIDQWPEAWKNQRLADAYLELVKGKTDVNYLLDLQSQNLEVLNSRRTK